MQFDANELKRYARHFAVDRIGLAGQEKLKQASVLCIGAGGLGSGVLPALVACGIGKLGIIDDDIVDLSNLQRQTLYVERDVGAYKAEVAAKKLKALNSHVTIDVFCEKLTVENAEARIKPYDIVIDGSDNFTTRYVTNDFCYRLAKPLISAAVYQFTAQLSVFSGKKGDPCYRCLYPEPPAPALVPNCSQAGVLGTVPNIVGVMQANEAIKLLLGLSKNSSQLVLLDLLDLSLRKLPISKNNHCALCVKGEKKMNYPNPSSSPIAVECIDVTALDAALADGAVLVDVREDWERQLCEIPNSVHQALGNTDYSAFDKSKSYIFYCKMGGRSATACAAAVAQGLTAKSLTGGVLAYMQLVGGDVLDY